MSPADHAPSWYAATVPNAAVYPALDGDARADVCVIGGGYTGLSTALHLAKAGRSVIVIEANRIGWGASGRNGGQLHSGQRQDVSTLEAWFGRERARQLFDLAEEAKRTVKGLIAEHSIPCDFRPGLIHAIHKRRYLAPLREEIEKLQRHYAYADAEIFDEAAIATAVGSPRYHGGWRDGSAGHLQPLAYAYGLAEAATRAGARLHEATAAIRLGTGSKPTVVTPRGTVTADAVVLAGNGYLEGIEPDTESRVMPIHNYILTTAPIPDRIAGLIPGAEAVSDSRFVVHYWRPTPDGRLLFGGGETYSRNFPEDIASFVRRHMLRIYPQLADVPISYAWGGTLAVTMNRLPYMRRLRPGLYTSGGYSGHGIGLATLAGKLLAEAIVGDTSRFDVMATLPSARFPGGRLLRYPSLVMAMTWYALRDRL